MAMDAGSQLVFVPAAAATDVGGALTPGVKFMVPVLEKCEISELRVFVTVTTSATPLVVQFRRRITPGSAVGETVIGTLTQPLSVATPAGTSLVKKVFDPTLTNELEVGDEVVIEVTTGVAAGSGFFGFRKYWKGEAILEAEEIASTT